MPRAVMQITPELLIEICKGLQLGKEERRYRVLKHRLPSDAEVVECYLDDELITVKIELESKAFTDGELLPSPVLASISESSMPVHAAIDIVRAEETSEANRISVQDRMSAARVLASRVEALETAIIDGGLDLSPCRQCGGLVVCIPDGLPMCEACAEDT